MTGIGNLEKVRKLLRLLSSPQDAEVVAAARALMRTLEADGADIHALAEAVGGGKLSEADMRTLYDSGFQDGKRAVENGKPPQFHEVTPWRDMVAEIAASEGASPWLKPHERDFVGDMERWCQRRDPTEKQGNWIHILWTRARKRRP
jgi:hypothetical protein